MFQQNNVYDIFKTSNIWEKCYAIILVNIPLKIFNLSENAY